MGKKLIVMDSMDILTFKQETGYQGKKNVLRITAIQCGAYDAETDRYYPIPKLLETLRTEGGITTVQPRLKKEEQKEECQPLYLADGQQPTSDEIPSGGSTSSVKAIALFHGLENKIESLDGKVKQVLGLCSKDTSLRNTQQPSKGDIITYFFTEKDPSPSSFLAYWKSKIALQRR